MLPTPVNHISRFWQMCRRPVEQWRVHIDIVRKRGYFSFSNGYAIHRQRVNLSAPLGHNRCNFIYLKIHVRKSRQDTNDDYWITVLLHHPPPPPVTISGGGAHICRSRRVSISRNVERMKKPFEPLNLEFIQFREFKYTIYKQRKASASPIHSQASITR